MTNIPTYITGITPDNWSKVVAAICDLPSDHPWDVGSPPGHHSFYIGFNQERGRYWSHYSGTILNRLAAHQRIRSLLRSETCGFDQAWIIRAADFLAGRTERARLIIGEKTGNE